MTVAVNAARAALCCILLMLGLMTLGSMLLGPTAQAADRVVAGSLGGQAPLWAFHVAVHKGFFVAEGIDLELNFAHSGAAVIQQLTAGSLDVALSVGITDPIHAIDKGASLALIRVMGNAAPYALIGKPGLKTIGDLKGGTVSVGGVNDITSVYLERMMAANGLGKNDYHAIAAGVAAARYAALKAGVADAALVLPPLNFQAVAAGYVTLGLAGDYVKDIPFSGMAVNRRWAAANAAVVKRLLAATDKSIAWLTETSHRGEAIDLLVKVAGSSKADADATYDYFNRIQHFEPSSKVSRAKLRNLVDLEKRDGRIDQAFNIDRLVMPGVTELTD